MGQGPGLGPRVPLAVVRGAEQGRGSGVSGQLLVSTPPGRRAQRPFRSISTHAWAIGVLRLQRKADHQFRRVSLVAEQVVHHERSPETPRPPRAESQHAGNDASESTRLHPISRSATRLAQTRDGSRERMAVRRPSGANERGPDPDDQSRLGREAETGRSRAHHPRHVDTIRSITVGSCSNDRRRCRFQMGTDVARSTTAWKHSGPRLVVREMEGQSPKIRYHPIRCDPLEHDLVLIRHAEEDQRRGAEPVRSHRGRTRPGRRRRGRGRRPPPWTAG